MNVSKAMILPWQGSHFTRVGVDFVHEFTDYARIVDNILGQATKEMGLEDESDLSSSLILF